MLPVFVVIRWLGRFVNERSKPIEVQRVKLIAPYW